MPLRGIYPLQNSSAQVHGAQWSLGKFLLGVRKRAQSVEIDAKVGQKGIGTRSLRSNCQGDPHEIDVVQNLATSISLLTDMYSKSNSIYQSYIFYLDSNFRHAV